MADKKQINRRVQWTAGISGSGGRDSPRNCLKKRMIALRSG